MSYRSVSLSLRRFGDRVWGGPYKIAGTVNELGVAGAYRVQLFHRRGPVKLLRQTWSGVDGNYEFSDIAYEEQGYFVVGYDHGADPVNAAISDLMTPEPDI